VDWEAVCALLAPLLGRVNLHFGRKPILDSKANGGGDNF
jgi:hypothetical protein